MALPKIQKKKTVNDLIKDYEASKNSTARIVPKSTTNKNTKTVTNFLTSAVNSAKNTINDFLANNRVHGGGGRRLLDDGSSIDLKTGETIQPTSSTPSSSYAGGGSSYSGNPAGMVDISNMLKAFDQAAEANKAVVDQSYNERRNDLLTSLKRYQEQNAKDVAAQQKTYLANQALVESAIAEADRQNRISAAARGLGGSGLQQLSQLQTLMSQGQTISDMATENQNVVNNLREVLANYDEDTQTALGNLATTRENSLKGINSELASNKANLEYQAREAAADRAQMAASTNAQIAAQNEAYAKEAQQQKDALQAELDYAKKQYENDLANAKSSKKIKAAKENYETTVATTLRDYMVPASSSTYKSAYDYLTNDYTNKLTNTGNLEKRTSLWNWIVNPSDYMDAKDELQGNKKFRLW
jgi:hypothetical protein